MAAVSLESYRVKDVTEWSPADVREFLLTVLPGHPCADFFTYTSGYVLCSLDKEDLRRQARDDEAANVIWAELKGCRLAAAAAPGSQFEATQQRGGLVGPPTVTVYVKMRQEIAIELEVLLSDLVRSLKAQIEQREGTPLEHQRLICNGMNMQDSRSLISYGIRHGSVILLVPQISGPSSYLQGRTQIFAPRGMMMVPGSKAWQPSNTQRPYMPVLCTDVSRNFPVNLEFGNTGEMETFLAAAVQEPPVLEIQPARQGQLPAETRVYLDPESEGVKLDSTGNVLAPSSQYDAFLHFGGSGGEVRVSVVTGAAVS
jgi:hypothetical protein